ncbi:MAG: dipeptidase [Methylacidiphilales bacterium]|nr:dipeptidase [Candidatus Methylacidiphilales bacterium]
MPDLSRILDAVDCELDRSLERLFALLRIASVSTEPLHAADCRRAAEWIAGDLTDLGFEASVRETGGHPAVIAKHFDGTGPRVLFYGHYDVQPVDPLPLWETAPFEPRITTGRTGTQHIVARGASDDKGQIMTFIEACRAYKIATGTLPIGVTVLIEGEEEMGSKHLPAFVEAHRDELAADVALVCDTGMWDRATPAITLSLRGMVYEEVRLRCADRDLHSGLFGGAAQNPIHVLARILAALHDETGRIAIPGFYEGVADLPADVRDEYARLNLSAAGFLGPVGLKVPAGERDRLLIEQISTRPSCDVNGIWGGYAGEGTKTIIPAEAAAKVSFRLVGAQDPAKVREAFHAFVRARIPEDCRVEFISHKGSPAVSLPFDHPQLDRARKALADEWGRPAVRVGSGGSIPIIGDFKRVLGLDSLMIGFALDDDRVHAPNEKYDLTSFHKGIRSWVRILHALAQEP